MAYTQHSAVIDFQRSEVYLWERAAIHPWYPKGIPQAAVTLLLARVETFTGVEIPWEYNPRATRWAWGGSVITLPNPRKAAWAYSPSVVIHEASHVVLKKLGFCDRHGPNFVGLYLQLLKACGGTIGKTNASEWAMSAAARGIQISNMKHLLLEHNVTAEGFYNQE